MTALVSREVSQTQLNRRQALLGAALTVFIRFGYRKTAMDEVARAAGISRQGLYLHFPTKEALFRAVVHHALSGQLAAAIKALSGSAALDVRLSNALDAWLGPYAGPMREDAADLLAASGRLGGPILSEHEARFEQALVAAITASPLMDVYGPAGIDASALAGMLHATAQGLKSRCAVRDDLRAQLAVTTRILCAPLFSSQL
jgi:AcrR family transcriptional regulator